MTRATPSILDLIEQQTLLSDTVAVMYSHQTSATDAMASAPSATFFNSSRTDTASLNLTHVAEIG